METNWWLIGIVIFFGIVLVFYIIKKNKKDEKELTSFLNNEHKIEEESELNDEI